jgi:4-amino-4-deoxy-L-arabinose transferase-like glycosyltransferase
MSAVDVRRPREPRAPARPPGRRDRPQRPRRSLTGRLRAHAATWDARWGAAVGAVLVAAFVLRVWGVDHGLPYAFNADENAHFVPRAIGMFGHGFDPGYFVNPPAFTYLLHVVFAVWFGGREGVSASYAANPTEVLVVARVTAAAVGTLAVWLLYLAGTRLFADRRIGLLAAALLAVAFLPVFYSHLALNDVPTLAPLCLCLYGVAGVLRFGRRRDFLLAGAALGVACATKYTAGIVLLALLAAGAAQFRAPGGHMPALRGLGLAGLAALAGFVAANPYALLDWPAFLDGLAHQSDTSGDAVGKLGLTEDNGFAYYLWTFTWGLGWVPLLAAMAGAVILARDERRLVAVLLPAPVLFVLFMGSQERFFGRWLIPVFPILCLLAAYFAIEAVGWASRRRPALRPTLLAVAAVALLAQGLVASLHNVRVLAREDTRNITRAWMVENIPPRTKVVVEPVVPDAWAQDPGAPSPLSANGNRWAKWPTSRSRIANDGSRLPPPGRLVNIEDYERTLYPGLVDEYIERGYCWVVSGSTQRGRAEAEPQVVPRAIAYYRELERRSRVALYVSPYDRGAGPVKFNFDWTFDFYPGAYHRPGPEMWVFRLRGGRCGTA